MDKRKRYGRKIRKTKNLYRRKKTAGQKVFGTVLLIVALSAIAFLGFCIGKPLLDYIGNIGKDEPADWTPAASYYAQHENDPQEDGAGTQTQPADGTDSANEAPDTEQSSSSASSAAEAVPGSEQPIGTNQPHSTNAQTSDTSVSAVSPVSYNALVAAEAPASALSNRASLAAVLAKAKSGGFNSVVIQLKDRNGYFRYKSSIEGVADSELDTGTMTLDEIMSVFTENEIVPIAEIAVLSDNKGCEVFTEMSYKCIDAPDTSWLEWVEKRRWANPESEASREYFLKISSELAAAGFRHILLTDVVFPLFQHYDTAYIAAKYFAADRYEMLYNVIGSGNMIEMKASDVIGESFGRTAEMLNDVSKLRENPVALIISRSDLPTDAGYPADAKTLVETTLSLAAKKADGLSIVPIIDTSGFDDAEKSKIAGLLVSLGYENYIIR